MLNPRSQETSVTGMVIAASANFGELKKIIFAIDHDNYTGVQKASPTACKERKLELRELILNLSGIHKRCIVVCSCTSSSLHYFNVEAHCQH